MSWTREKLKAGFSLLNQQQFENEGGTALLPVRGPDPEKLCTQQQISQLKRGVTRDMAEAAGHAKLPLLKIIRAKCLDCCGGSKAEVALCGLTDCPNWPYRFGKNPFSTRTGRPGGNPEALAKARAARLEQSEAAQEASPVGIHPPTDVQVLRKAPSLVAASP